MNIMLFGNSFADKSRFFQFRLSFEMTNFRSHIFIRPKDFVGTPFVVIDNRIGRFQNRLRGAIVLLQFYGFSSRIVFFKIKNILNIRTAPSVNTLVRIPYDTNILPFGGQ